MTRSRIFLFAVLSMSLNARAAEPPAPDLPQPLSETIAALDSAVFDAFNRCAAPEQLAKHASYFAENVEFYHDTGGVTWNRADMLANTSRNACGKFTRELVPGSLAVFPIKDFGAIEQGSHRFCQTDASKCEGLADFTILWRHSGGRWEITRVLSYGHRPAAGSLLQPPSR
ncbi:MAG: nuclear transport factor 2 family protein [Dokdonella sp.]|jgi:hypothetical protein|uniref:nuclear transport factor 2 family protein n=2 Tax=Dokdonella sp. TaxID=2291710 RepID=UPI001B52B73E|nr:nuclear transport factor 2 family protein [Dokdonella sp.]MBK8123588.1 nuclear transport factor 2 family protein [Dokdonella sp.]MBP6326129.1 nuclear transport factor 2 family protein [Dokdonella sp.]MBP6330451.1 nuclear transport factor 2 family protein [Dokdonella sp.]HNV07157.1 nuclear transport factor 2 family protein [Dokdonella sp.]HQV48686.1 nuclear transport factor 2 family protein [Dokdonella sp.]